jgi:chromosome partitioning protein
VTFSECICASAGDVTHAGKPLSVSLLATSSHLRTLEREIIYTLTRMNYGLDAVVGRIYRILKEQLSRPEPKFDFVIFDCAPGISAVTEAAIRLADMVVVPTLPDFLSSYGLLSFCKNLWSNRAPDLPKPRRLPYVLITRRRPVNEHDKIEKKIFSEKTAADRSFIPLDTVIKESRIISEALGKTGSGPTFINKWGETMPVFQKLADEIKEAIGVN